MKASNFLFNFFIFIMWKSKKYIKVNSILCFEINNCLLITRRSHHINWGNLRNTLWSFSHKRNVELRSIYSDDILPYVQFVGFMSKKKTYVRNLIQSDHFFIIIYSEMCHNQISRICENMSTHFRWLCEKLWHLWQTARKNQQKNREKATLQLDSRTSSKNTAWLIFFPWNVLKFILYIV